MWKKCRHRIESARSTSTALAPRHCMPPKGSCACEARHTRLGSSAHRALMLLAGLFSSSVEQLALLYADTHASLRPAEESLLSPLVPWSWNNCFLAPRPQQNWYCGTCNHWNNCFRFTRRGVVQIRWWRWRSRHGSDRRKSLLLDKKAGQQIEIG